MVYVRIRTSFVYVISRNNNLLHFWGKNKQLELASQEQEAEQLVGGPKICLVAATQEDWKSIKTFVVPKISCVLQLMDVMGPF